MTTENDFMANDSTGIDSAVLLWFANEKEMVVYLPAIYFAGTLMIVGLVGNGFVAYVYGYRLKKTCANVYIFWLSVFDIFCCAFCIPFEMFQVRFPLLYGDAIPCKLFRVVSMVAYVSEGLMLLCIALDRYHKICHPMRTFLIQSPRRNILVTFVTAMCISWPSAFVYGTMTIQTAVPRVVGTTCSIDDAIGNVIPGVFYGFLLFIVVGGFIMLLFIYTRIVAVVWRWIRRDLGESGRRRENASENRESSRGNDSTIFVTKTSSCYTQHLSKVPSLDSNDSADVEHESQHTINCDSADVEHESQHPINCDSADMEHESQHPINCDSADVEHESQRTINCDSADEEYVPETLVHEQRAGDLESTSDNSTGINNDTSLPAQIQQANPQSEPKRRAHMSKTTFIFILVTASFVISYVPYLVTEIVLKCNIVKFKDQSFWVQQVMEVAVKSFCINNASNPIIYSMFNSMFRRECCRLFGPTSHSLKVTRS